MQNTGNNTWDRVSTKQWLPDEDDDSDDDNNINMLLLYFFFSLQDTVLGPSPLFTSHSKYSLTITLS